MKEFDSISFDAAACRRELDAFGRFLEQPRLLTERKDLQPFFRKNLQLSTFIGSYIPDLGISADRVAFELEIRGDFAADIVVGNASRGTYCMIELEEADPDSIFRRAGRKSTREWSPKFEHGFSQFVDWFWALDDHSRTNDFRRLFGGGHVKLYGLLVVGRSAGISEADRARLRWREERVVINSHPIHCVTYDDLHEELKQRLAMHAADAASNP